MNAVDGHKDHMIWHINSSRALTEVKFMKYGIRLNRLRCQVFLN